MALRQLGAIFLDQGQLIQAYPLLKQAADLQPDDPELQLKFGQAALALRQLTQARDLAQQALGKKPGDETALLLLVDTAVAPDEIKETQTLIESLREKDQDRASYHLALGILDLRQKNDAAEDEFKAALELDPKSSGAYSALGRLYWSRNDLKAADEAMKTAADLSPLRSPMQLRYVDFKLRQGAVPEAKAILEGINNKFPDYLPARVSLMKMACAERLDDDCTARVQDILAQDPINFDAMFQDSVLNLVKGDAAGGCATGTSEQRLSRETATPVPACRGLFGVRGTREPRGAPRCRRQSRKPLERSHQARSAFRGGDPDVRRAADQERQRRRRHRLRWCN